jgi:hypothetical protein
MSTFPVILLPPAIEAVKNEFPSIPSKPEMLEIHKPGAYPKKIDKKLIAIECVIVAILTLAMFTTFSHRFGLAALMLGSIAISLQTWILRKNHRERVKIHDQKIKKYQSDLESNDRKEKEYKRLLLTIKSQENLIKHRQEKIYRVLANTQQSNAFSDARHGLSENYFYTYLLKYFGNKIEKEKGFIIPNFSYPYSPDFIYHDSSTGLHIDIEIDEPYCFDNQKRAYKAIHDNDDKRNNFFLGKNWIVIRFAEEQIIRQPESCCRVIAETIADIYNNNSILYKFERVPMLNPIKRWTSDEALQMAAKEYRKTYINIIS